MQRSIIFGIIGGAMGAAIWAGISYGVGVELGWIAWGVGGLVGLGFHVGADDDADRSMLGLLAVVVAALSLLGAKYAVATMDVRDAERAAHAEIDRLASAEGATVMALAFEAVDEQQARGEEVSWPPGAVPGEPDALEHFPPAAAAAARERWEAMEAQERQDYAWDLAEARRAYVEDSLEAASSESLKGQLSLFDIVFMLLALGTAYKVAADQVGED